MISIKELSEFRQLSDSEYAAYLGDRFGYLAVVDDGEQPAALIPALESLAIDYRSQSDDAKWRLGDLLNYYAMINAGRPSADADGLTISDFAKLLDMEKQRTALSEMASNARFYPPDVRDRHPQLSWYRFSEARRAFKHAPEPIEQAMQSLDAQADKTEIRPQVSPIVAYLNALERAARDVRRLIQAAEKAGIVSFRLTELAMEIEHLQQAADKVRS